MITQDQLLALGTLIARAKIKILLGEQHEAPEARGVIAGVLASSKVLLPADQFRHFVIGNEIDPIELSASLELAQSEVPNPEPVNTPIIEV